MMHRPYARPLIIATEATLEVRAASIGGLGAAKTAANYAASLLPGS